MKLAIVTSAPHTKLGGIPTNNRVLYSFLSKKHDITEFPISRAWEVEDVATPDINTKIDYSLTPKNPKARENHLIYKRKSFKDLYIDFDLVIFRCTAPPKKWVKHPKSITVQHFDKQFYKLWGKGGFWYPIGFMFASVFLGQGALFNPFKKASNSVFYDEATELKTSGRKFYAPLGKMKSSEIKMSMNSDEHIWVGRLTMAKGLKYLADIDKGVHLNVYGDGEKNDYAMKHLSNFHGKLNSKDLMKKIKASSTLICTSLSEGFGWTIVEALSMGTPVLMFDTFQAVGLFKKCKSVYVFKKGDTKGMLEKAREIESLTQSEYSLLSREAAEWAKRNISYESFEKHWTSIIESFENKKG